VLYRRLVNARQYGEEVSVMSKGFGKVEREIISRIEAHGQCVLKELSPTYLQPAYSRAASTLLRAGLVRRAYQVIGSRNVAVLFKQEESALNPKCHQEEAVEPGFLLPEKEQEYIKKEVTQKYNKFVGAIMNEFVVRGTPVSRDICVAAADKHFNFEEAMGIAHHNAHVEIVVSQMLQ